MYNNFMQSSLDGLNEAQKEAVLATDGPVLMLAGAGSGKTKTLTHRIAYLLTEKACRPENILAVTFTNKAAGEMRHRVAKLLGMQGPDPRPLPFLGTFHSIANKILRREAALVGYSSNFLIYDTADSQALIKKLLKKNHIDEKSITPSAVGWAISSAKNELIGPQKYKEVASGRVGEVAATIYPEYQNELRAASAMDFDDLIMQLVKLFQNEHEVLARYQNQFQYILVDEYQDTNGAQYQLVKLLAAKHHNICVVGDDWQSIYSWRGANYQNILNFENDYPQTKIIKLEQNYRSTQHILDAAHQVITKNLSRSHKELWTDRGVGEKVHILPVRDELEEGRTVIRTIEQIRSKDPNMKFRDCAVLYRTNAQSRSLEESFIRYGVPYQVVGGVRFYDRREVKDILAYMRVLYQPNDLVSLGRILNVPTRGVGQKSAQAVLDYIGNTEQDAVQVLSNVADVPGLRGKALKSLNELGVILKELRETQGLSVSDLMEALIKRIDYFGYLDDGSAAAEERVENVQELVGVAKAYNHADLETFLTEVSLIADVDSHDDNADSVTLMTMHAAKGLEFEVVFVVGMEEGIFPHSRTFFEPEELEEERRLCYVAMTRAKSQLFLLYASSRLLYGTTQHNIPSRFIADIPAEYIDQPTCSEKVESISISDNSFFNDMAPQIDLSVGQKVLHGQFGEGKVKKIDGDELIIDFDQVGEKTLNAQYAPLQKL